MGDEVEATFRAEEALETEFIGDYDRDVGIPALLIAHRDFARGVLSPQRRQDLATAARAMVDDLAVVAQDELAELRPDGVAPADAAPLPGEGFRVTCFGGRNVLDDLAAAMLAQVPEAEGAAATQRPHSELAPSRFRSIDAQAENCVVLTFLDAAPTRASMLQVRRIKRASPHMRVGVLISSMPENVTDGSDRLADTVAAPDAETLQTAEGVGADLVVTSLESVVRAAFSVEAPRGISAPVAVSA